MSILPVKVVTDADLEENGGVYLVQKGIPAVPVWGFTKQGNMAVSSKARPVYVVTEAEFNVGDFVKAHGQPMRVIENTSKVVESREAIPVWAVNDWPDTGAVPNAPTNLTATAVSTSQIDLSWADNSGDETGFNIYRDNVLIDTVAADTTSYSDTGLDFGTEYSYYITAVNATGESDPSNTDTATTDVEYLLLDNFITNEAAPLASPRTCEPGPGTLTLVDTVTGADAAISGGRYLRPRPTSGQGYTNYGFVSVGGFTRTQGLSFYAESESGLISNYYPIAVNNSSALVQSVQAAAIWFSSTAGLRILTPFSVAIGSSLSINIIYQTMIVMRSSGFLAFIRGGSQFPDWTLLYPSSLRNQVTLYALSPNFDSDAKHDTVRVLQRGVPFDSDFGGTTYFDATPIADDTGAGEANGVTEFIWTPAVGQTLSIYFRRTDDDNAYRLDCVQAAGTIRLYRRESAADTELDAGKTQTWTAGTPVRIVIRHHAGEIRTFTEVVGGTTAKHVVTGETFNLAITGIKVTGFTAGSDFACWPTVWAGDDEWSLALP